MRAAVGLLLLSARAYADEGSIVRQAILHEGVIVDLDTAVRMRADGKPSVGAGLATRLVHGQYELGVSLMRWHPLEQDDPQRSWELSLRATRSWQLSNRTRAYVVAGTSYELVELDIEKQTQKLGRIGAMVGAGLSTKFAGHTAWVELTLENKHWLERPPDLEREDEMLVMLMFGFSF
jgi:hypothetical protein